jgi:hypothetical protein
MRGADERSWLGAWIDLTTWWVEPARAAAQSLPAQADQLLSQLIEGVATRFGGGRIDVIVQGRRIEASLDALRLQRRDNRRVLRIDLSDGVFDGIAFDDLTLLAYTVRVDVGLEPTLVVGDLELQGRAALGPLVAWVDRYLPAWRLVVDGDAIVARHGARDVSYLVEPHVRDDEVHFELRAAQWRGRRVRIPSWLRLERTVALQMPSGWSLVDAVRREHTVTLVIRAQEVEQRLRASSLRDAVMSGGRLQF